ncbi:hypothetical protein [Thermomonospora umbrina]|uniref:Uncharacterized protein n=1 Tax=Thermomonospora umbrina TaxID=111806 RepID=A0A3D9STP7_9ACTN|nr:hypothetical protein [Thermomonospora umbrina]REE95944.1 hypothetical protein DFJ69_1359 [Thermomonospora umbrina]
MNLRLPGIAAITAMAPLLVAGCAGDEPATGPTSPRTPGASATPGGSGDRPSDGTASPGGPVHLGPDGYGALKLGMTLDQAEATGLITVKLKPPKDHGCGTFDLKTHPRPASTAGGNLSAGLGVASIFAVADMRTPEGITLGSSLAQVQNAYPRLQNGPNLSFTKVPGNPAAVYTFLIADGRVKELVLDLATQDCHN